MGYEDTVDPMRTHDAKGKPITCFKCGTMARRGAPIAPCDYCDLYWHHDCLDPPMLFYPGKPAPGSQRAPELWKCPNHVDHDLLGTDASAVQYRHNTAGGNTGRRQHKIRRPRNPIIVDTALRRGFVNNGLIEIENEPSDDDSGLLKQQSFGQIYRVPEKGVKLDFIDKVKRYVRTKCL